MPESTPARSLFIPPFGALHLLARKGKTKGSRRGSKKGARGDQQTASQAKVTAANQYVNTALPGYRDCYALLLRSLGSSAVDGEITEARCKFSQEFGREIAPAEDVALLRLGPPYRRQSAAGSSLDAGAATAHRRRAATTERAGEQLAKSTHTAGLEKRCARLASSETRLRLATLAGAASRRASKSRAGRARNGQEASALPESARRAYTAPEAAKTTVSALRRASLAVAAGARSLAQLTEPSKPPFRTPRHLSLRRTHARRPQISYGARFRFDPGQLSAAADSTYRAPRTASSGTQYGAENAPPSETPPMQPAVHSAAPKAAPASAGLRLRPGDAELPHGDHAAQAASEARQDC
ncbi:hypothetical protein ON010_g1737 [Phytophthora cinnamomi]|nr:hypothetical protein ON010_g1737 [Phytophthora cinnamomi]